MRRGALLLSVVLAGTLSFAEERPLNLGVQEATRAHLVQVLLTAEGPMDQVDQLTAQDLVVQVDGQAITSLSLDRVRADEGAGGAHTVMPVSYLLYFDQPHLTMRGRAKGLRLARDLLPYLLDGSQIAVASSGKELRLVQSFTSDRVLLDDAITEVERNREDWSFYASQEEQRIEHISREARAGDLAQARGLANTYAREEEDLARESVARFTTVLSIFQDRPQPKVVLYFGDTLRDKPGEHFLDILGLVNAELGRSDERPLEAGDS